VRERPAFELAGVFRRHGASYERANAGHLGRVERRVIGAITACRTAALGGHVERCEDCGLSRIAYNSCRNRHCPKCQGAARAEWLAARLAELMPVPYFHVVFTVPPAAAEIAFQNKRTVYALLMRAAAQALMTLAARRLSARIGLIAVFHSWGQTLTHHPHVHCLVPGGGVALDGGRWVGCKPNFLLSVHALSRTLRRIFLDGLKAAFRRGDLGFFGHLARLTPRIEPPSPIPLLAVDDDEVAFSYRDYRRGGRSRVMRLAPHEFIRRFLMHVLPDGFHRIRHYGFLAKGERGFNLSRARDLLEPPAGQEPGGDAPLADGAPKVDAPRDSVAACPDCGGLMRRIGRVLAAHVYRCDTS
jgi:hypothetical protein